ncbi:UNVERIFIED_CONTAM: COBRA-like protein 11 [Sesamum radiatum]|uniref:COBRA-like protein 11 n=1 Tax=Sesamum radiatum TaxID=300843 RepID=A0AAW2T2Q2_SESRA
MPWALRLENDGYKCPALKCRATRMHVCCVRDLKFKAKNLTTKYFKRRKGDPIISYDILQPYDSNYLAQVTIDNNNPLGRLDHWNLTWQWMRGEFISSMGGAYTLKKDVRDCIYSAAGNYYKDFDFSQVMNCGKNPIICDLPAEKEKNKDVGNLPDTKSWRTEFPDPSGLQVTSLAIASWQVVCNIARPKSREAQCCVLYSACYNEPVIPCNSCSCGCGDMGKCNADARALLLPPELLLVPFANRSGKALGWARIKHFKIPSQCPVLIIVGCLALSCKSQASCLDNMCGLVDDNSSGVKNGRSSVILRICG